MYEKDDCVELLEEALSHLEEKPEAEHLVEIVKGVIGELTEEESEGEMEHDEEGNEMAHEDDLSDDELEEEAHKEMRGEPHLKIMIGMKPKK